MPELKDQYITLSHGGGGKASQRLIQQIFGRTLSNPILDRFDDSALLDACLGRIAFTTDSYVIDPIFFPGGDIGELAVNGTINDLCTSGAEPLYLSLAVILEEGLPIADLRRIAVSIAKAAADANVRVVTGDTKVVPRGKADKIYINTAGIGVVRATNPPSLARARPGDNVILSGTLGDHGMAVLAARGDLALELDAQSDTAPLHDLARAILKASDNVHCLKDPTRGGLASALNEIAQQSKVEIEIDDASLPVTPSVRGACEILGIDPLDVANEGKLIVVAQAEDSASILNAMRQHSLGREARVIGKINKESQGLVLLKTTMGGRRIVDMQVGQALPRIC